MCDLKLRIVGTFLSRYFGTLRPLRYVVYYSYITVIFHDFCSKWSPPVLFKVESCHQLFEIHSGVRSVDTSQSSLDVCLES